MNFIMSCKWHPRIWFFFEMEFNWQKFK